MKKALVITTGGTIVSADKGEGAVPDKKNTDNVLLAASRFLNNEGFACDIVNAFGDNGIDSSDMSPAEWLALTRIINEASLGGIKKFLIIHGTDTMAYSAAWLSLTAAPDVTVVITGSQHIQGDADFDGITNLCGAARTLREKESGVFIYFCGRTIEGAYAHKSNCEALDAFVPTAEEGQRVEPTLFDPATLSPDWEKTAAKLDPVFLTPASVPDFKPCKILILVGFGSGNMAQRIHEKIERDFSDIGEKPVIIAASSCEKGKKNPAFYGGVGISELSKKKFSVFGEGEYSLEFIIALSYLSLMLAPDAPEQLLERYLDKF